MSQFFNGFLWAIKQELIGFISKWHRKVVLLSLYRSLIVSKLFFQSSRFVSSEIAFHVSCMQSCFPRFVSVTQIHANNSGSLCTVHWGSACESWDARMTPSGPSHFTILLGVIKLLYYLWVCFHFYTNCQLIVST